MSALVLHVRLHDGRYHGEGDWPPSPARLFQALVAGGGLAGPLGNGEREALRWLEKKGPPSSRRRAPGSHAGESSSTCQTTTAIGSKATRFGWRRSGPPRRCSALTFSTRRSRSSTRGLSQRQQAMKTMRRRSARSPSAFISSGEASTWLGAGAK